MQQTVVVDLDGKVRNITDASDERYERHGGQRGMLFVHREEVPIDSYTGEPLYSRDETSCNAEVTSHNTFS